MPDTEKQRQIAALQQFERAKRGSSSSSSSPASVLAASSSSSDSKAASTTSNVSLQWLLNFGSTITPLSRAQLNLSNFATSRVLDRVSATKFETLLEQVQRLGAVVHQGITIHFNKDTKIWTVDPRAHINLPPNAAVFPVCQAGENRSQVTYCLLHRINRLLPDTHRWQISAPHGAEGSVDPFIQPTMSPEQLNNARDGSVDWDRETAYQYHEVSPEPMFETELKTRRITRRCEDACLSHLSQQHRLGDNSRAALQRRDTSVLRDARNYMSDHYFHRGIIQSRGHIVCFNRSLHVMMMRLVEVATLHRVRLEGVVFYPVDTMDPIVVKALPTFVTTLHQLLQPRAAPTTSAPAIAPLLPTTASVPIVTAVPLPLPSPAVAPPHPHPHASTTHHYQPPVVIATPLPATSAPYYYDNATHHHHYPAAHHHQDMSALPLEAPGALARESSTPLYAPIISPSSSVESSIDTEVRRYEEGLRIADDFEMAMMASRGGLTSDAELKLREQQIQLRKIRVEAEAARLQAAAASQQQASTGSSTVASAAASAAATLPTVMDASPAVAAASPPSVPLVAPAPAYGTYPAAADGYTSLTSTTPLPPGMTPLEYVNHCTEQAHAGLAAVFAARAPMLSSATAQPQPQPIGTEDYMVAPPTNRLTDNAMIVAAPAAATTTTITTATATVMETSEPTIVVVAAAAIKATLPDLEEEEPSVAVAVAPTETVAPAVDPLPCDAPPMMISVAKDVDDAVTEMDRIITVDHQLPPSDTITESQQLSPPIRSPNHHPSSQRPGQGLSLTDSARSDGYDHTNSGFISSYYGIQQPHKHVVSLEQQTREGGIMVRPATMAARNYDYCGDDQQPDQSNHLLTHRL